MTGVAEDRTHSERRKILHGNGGVIRVMQLQSKDCSQKPGRGNERFFPGVSKGTKLCRHLDPRLLTSEAMTENMYVVCGVLLRRVLGN